MKTLVSISLLHQHKLNRKIQELISKQLRKKANNKIKTNKQTNSTFIHWALDWLLGRILELKLDPDPDQSYNIEIVKRLIWTESIFTQPHRIFKDELCQTCSFNICQLVIFYLVTNLLP